MTDTKVPAPKLVIFDWDNTLISNWETIVESLNATFAFYNLPTISLAESRAKLQHSLREAFPKFFGQNAESAKKMFYTHFEAQHLESLRVLSGAEDLLKFLQISNIDMAIVSNKTGHYLRSEVSSLNWDSYFKLVLGAQDCQFDKPDAMPVHKILNHLNIDSGKHVWFVGDSEIDIQCAEASASSAIFVGDQPTDKIKFHIDYKCLTLSDVKSRILEAF